MLRVLLSTFVLIFAMLAAHSVLAGGYDYVVCESRDYSYAECYVEGAREVSLHRRLSDSDCRRGKDWGVQRGVIWVDNGCAAEFAVEYRGGGYGHESGQWADREAVDLYRFTSLLNRSLDDAGRLRIVEMMWQIVYADGKVNEFEDNVIWRAADLLHVSSRDRIEMRRRVSGQDA